MFLNWKADAAWSVTLLAVLVGISLGLPQRPMLQFSFVPNWCLYWMMTRVRIQVRLIIAVVAGMLLETAWGLPPGGMTVYFLAMAWLIKVSDQKSEEVPITPLHGFLGGFLGAVGLQVWLFCYLWLWGKVGLTFSLSELIFTPVLGGCLGAVVFFLARKFDFEVLRLTARARDED